MAAGNSEAVKANTLAIKEKCGAPFDSNEAMNRCLDDPKLRADLLRFTAAKKFSENAAADFCALVFSERFRLHITMNK